MNRMTNSDSKYEFIESKWWQKNLTKPKWQLSNLKYIIYIFTWILLQNIFNYLVLINGKNVKTTLFLNVFHNNF